MVTDIESANVYFLKPLNALDADYDPTQDYTPEELATYPDLIEDNALVIGSKHVMNQLAVEMQDDDIFATMGVFPDRCVILTYWTRERCIEAIKKAKEIYDRQLKETLDA